MQPDGRRLEFGWFLPTAGDTTAYGLASAQVASVARRCSHRVVAAAEAAGFEYMRCRVDRPRAVGGLDLERAIDGRALQVDPHAGGGAAVKSTRALAKMIATFDQLSGGPSAST